jgi:hypothetical protein
MTRMEDTEQPGGTQPEEDLGEDHREGPPGYDLDEQKAIEELEEERSEDS